MIILLNCSLKGKIGNSRYFLTHLKSCCTEPCTELEIASVLRDIPAFAETLRQAKALVLGAPLYVDGMPAQAVRLMELLYESFRGQFPALSVYVVSNLGFYESAQIRTLLSIAKNWCAKMGVAYGGGLAIGAGGMMSAFKSVPLGKGPNKSLGEGIKKLATAIEGGQPMEDVYLRPSGIPRFAYIIAAHTLFRRTGRKNGVSV